MKIGEISLKAGAALAPMAGFTDAPCRRMAARHGASFTVSEMVSAKALTFGDKKSFRLMAHGRNDAPWGVQLFGAEPETMAQAVRLIQKVDYDFLDLNMGCPAPKITSSGAGSRLMLAVYPAGTTVMCAAVPLLALAGFVYYLYQKEFFCSGLGLGLAVVGMWFAHRAIGSAWSSRYVIVEVVLLILVLALLALTVAIGRNGGKWGKDGAAKMIFSGASNYALAYGVLAVAAAFLVVGIFAPAAALYLMWAGIALLFVMAVYYTIHMM